MLGSNADCHESRGKPLQPWHDADQAHQQRRLHLAVALQRDADDVVLHDHLHALGHPHWKFPPLAHRSQFFFAGAAIYKLAGQKVRGRHRILHREVDADSTDRRHRMGGVADAKQAGPGPTLQAIDRHREQLHIVPCLHVGDAVLQDRHHRHDIVTKGVEAARLDRIVLALGDDIGALPVVAAVESHHHLAGLDARKQPFLFVRTLAGTKPKYVHRRTDFLDIEAGPLAHDRMTTIAGDGEIRMDLDRAFRRVRDHARDLVARPDQVDRLRLHHDVELRKPLAALAQEIEEVPLRHHGNERVFDIEAAKIG